MHLEDSTIPLVRTGKAAMVPALVCAVICVVLIRAGFLSFFFLVPLGICAVVYGSFSAWVASVFAILGNGVWLVARVLRFGGSGIGLLDVFVFSIMVLGFTWIMAGNPAIQGVPPLRTLFRFIAASTAVALTFLAVIFSLGSDEGFSVLFRSQIEAISSAYIAGYGVDADQQAFLERQLNADRIIELFSLIILRGGALVSAVFLFFFSRQTAFLIARLFRHRAGGIGSDLIGFFAPRKAIWVLSLSLPLILLCRMPSLKVIEIAAWNLLVVCVIMFLAQGGGIILCNLARRPMPVIMRLLCGIVCVFILFSPGLNVLALGILVLVGIAENWFPMRTGLFKNPVGS
jgi:hypothetical protein